MNRSIGHFRKFSLRDRLMLRLLFALIINTIAVFGTAYILPGIHLKNFWTGVVVAIVLGIVNAIIRPIIFILTLPINILTLGLFSFVIMGFMVYLVSWLIPGFTIDNFGWAILFSLIMAIINWLLWALIPK
jgi:putative membrane protein